MGVSFGGVFSDLESPCCSYFVAVTNLTGIDDTPEPNVRAFQSAGDASSISASILGLALEHAVTYKIGVRGCNAAGACADVYSNEVTVDTTPPATKDAVVIDGDARQVGWEGVDMEYSRSQYSLFSTYSGFSDPESGILHYEAQGINQFSAPFTPVAFSVGSTIMVVAPESSPMQEGVRYTVRVAAVNGAQLKNSSSTDGVIIDLTEPVVSMPVLVDSETGKVLVPTLTLPDRTPAAQLASVRSILNVSWTATDALSGIHVCGLEVGTFPSGSDVLPFTDGVEVEPGQWQMDTSSVELPAGFPLFATITCCDKVQFCARRSPNWAAVIDNLPPNAGVACDGFNFRSCIQYVCVYAHRRFYVRVVPCVADALCIVFVLGAGIKVSRTCTS